MNAWIYMRKVDARVLTWLMRVYMLLVPSDDFAGHHFILKQTHFWIAAAIPWDCGCLHRGGPAFDTQIVTDNYVVQWKPAKENLLSVAISLHGTALFRKILPASCWGRSHQRTRMNFPVYPHCSKCIEMKWLKERKANPQCAPVPLLRSIYTSGPDQPFEVEYSAARTMKPSGAAAACSIFYVLMVCQRGSKWKFTFL